MGRSGIQKTGRPSAFAAVFLAVLSGCDLGVGPSSERLSVAALPPARLGHGYEARWEASGGEPPYVWELGSAPRQTPPEWLSLASTGEAAGIPTAVGTWRFTVKVASADGQVELYRASLRVWPADASVLDPDESCRDYPGWAIATFEDATLDSLVRRGLRFMSPPPDLLSTGMTCELLSLGPEYVSGVRQYNGSPIGSLSGIQNVTALQSLYLSDFSISDLSPLSELEELASLQLLSNAVTDLTPLANLRKLRTLDLRLNEISDVGPLAELKSLANLQLNDNNISDISALSGLDSLRELHLSDNLITDVSPLAGLGRLWDLELGNNNVSNVAPLASLTGLVTLVLSGNSVADVLPLSGLDNLRYLYLSGNGLGEISALTQFPQLTWLSLGRNGITDLSPLSELTALGWLNLDGNAIADLGPLSELTALEWLNLDDNGIADISPLAALMQLEQLFLESNSITDLNALRDKPTLFYLQLRDNPTLSDISPLFDTPGLRLNTQWVEGVDLRGTVVSCADVAALSAAVYAQVQSDCP